MVFLSHGVTALETLRAGVDLFFVLSGFLIGRIYLRSQLDAHGQPGSFTLWGFWSARWFRTLPPYLTALALFALLQLVFHKEAVHLRYVLFLQNYLGMDGFVPSWSLCVEEHFYLALPLLGGLTLWLLPRRSLLWLLPLAALIPQALRLVAWHRGELTYGWYWRSHLHCEGMVLGVWLAYLFVDRRDLWDRLRGAALALSVLPVGMLAYEQMHPVESMSVQVVVFLVYAVGFAAWVRVLYDLRWEPRFAPARLVKRAVQGLALASYSIYLVHTVIFIDFRVLIEGMHRGPLKTLLVLAVALAGSTIFYFCVERPTIALRARVLKS